MVNSRPEPNENTREVDLEKIVAEFGTMVSGIAHRMIQNKELAQEAAQEVWYQVIKSIDSFRGDSTFSTWLYTIARRTILNYAKEEKKATLVELKEFRALPEVLYNGADEDMQEWIKEICDWCITALNHCLTNNARLIFVFRENAELSYFEIGKIMEMSEDNVRQIYSRSYKKIVNFMSDTCPLYNPEGSCKCRICKHVKSIDLEKEYTKFKKIIRLADLYQKFEKELPRKNYWEKIYG